MTQQLKDAYKTGNFAVIDDLDKKRKQDIEPIADLLEAHDENIFNVVKDDSGHDVSVINAPNGMFFVKVEEDAAAREAAKKAGTEIQKAVYKPTTKVGYYSKNGGRAEVTSTKIEDVLTDITMLLLSGSIGYVVGNMITKSLTGRVTQEAAAAAAEAQAAYGLKKAAQNRLADAVKSGDKAAIDAATAALKEATTAADKAFLNGASKFVNPGRWTKFVSFFRRWPKLTGGIVGAIVMVVAQLLLEFIWGRINKDFFLQVEIYNFDRKSWKVDSWHHDNGIIAGGGAFSAESMPPPTCESDPFSSVYLSGRLKI